MIEVYRLDLAGNEKPLLSTASMRSTTMIAHLLSKSPSSNSRRDPNQCVVALPCCADRYLGSMLLFHFISIFFMEAPISIAQAAVEAKGIIVWSENDAQLQNQKFLFCCL